MRNVLLAAVLTIASTFGAAISSSAKDADLPVGAVSRFGSPRWPHGAPIFAVAASADGSLVASAGEDQRIRIWDSATGLLRATAQAALSPDASLVFAPDGKMLACAGGKDNSIVIWNLGLRLGKDTPPADVDELPTKLQGHQGPVFGVAFAPSGKLLASAGADKICIIRDAATGRELRRLAKHDAEITALAWLDGGATLVTGSRDGVIRLWSAATAKEIRRLDAGGIGHVALAASCDGTKLGIACWSSSSFWHFGTQVRVMESGSGKILVDKRLYAAVRAIAFSPDGRRLAVGTQKALGEGNLIFVFDAATGGQRTVLYGQSQPVSGLVFADNNWLVSGALDGSVRRWDLPNSEKSWYFDGNRGHATPASVIGLSSDGKRLACADPDGWICIWNTATGDRVGTVMHDAVRSLAFSNDGSHLLSSGSGNAKLWEMAKNTLVVEQKIAGSNAALAPDGRTFAAGEEKLPGRLIAWDAVTGKAVTAFNGPQSAVNVVAFSKDGTALASGHLDGSLCLWDSKTGKERWRRDKLKEPIRALAFAADGLLLATASDRDVILWDMGTGAVVERLPIEGGPFNAVTFGPAGAFLVVRRANQSQEWFDIAPNRIRTVLPNQSTMKALAISADGLMLATAQNDTTLLLWKSPSVVVPAHAPPPPSIAKLKAARDSLANQDPALRREARATLLAGGKAAVALLRQNLSPIAAPDAKQLTQWTTDLDSSQFKLREKATAELRQLGELARPFLEEILARKPSLEVRMRAEKLLADLGQQPISQATWTALTAIAILDRIGDPDSLAALTELSRGAERAFETQAAKAALSRTARGKQ